MNGPQHYAEAERLLRLADDEGIARRDPFLTEKAQTHATLALVAATVLPANNAADLDNGLWGVVLGNDDE